MKSKFATYLPATFLIGKAVPVSGSDFTLEADASATIIAGRTYTFQIKLTPTSADPNNSTVRIGI